MFTAAALRSILVFQASPLRNLVFLLLAAWLLACVASSLLASRLPWVSAYLIGVEVILTLALLLNTRTDFFAFLFCILSMQAMLQFTPAVVAGLIGFSTLLTFIILIRPYGAFQAVALALVYSAVGVFLAAYIWFTRRARVIQDEHEALVGQLRGANRRLEFYTQQMQQLAVVRERQHLARELHDSVTQTIFSMTLTTQSALLLLERDYGQVAVQLERLDQLTHNALAEMQVLISRLAPEDLAGEGFAAALQKHLENRRQLENLMVTLETSGSQPLAPAEEAGLFRIAQEALNNVVKHAGVSEASLRLHLADPLSMEIEDCGAGFDLQQARESGRVGLASMQERATEIGWQLFVETSPGGGTRVRVEKHPTGAHQA